MFTKTARKVTFIPNKETPKTNCKNNYEDDTFFEGWLKRLLPIHINLLVRRIICFSEIFLKMHSFTTFIYLQMLYMY